MTQAQDDNGIEAEAASWVIKTHDEVVSDETLRAFTFWLRQSRSHVKAYDQAEMLWIALGAAPRADSQASGEGQLADQISTGLARWHGRRQVARVASRRVAMGAAIAGALAAGLAGFFLLTRGPQEQVQTYQTLKGQKRTLVLSDGTRVTLNTDTHIVVHMSALKRRIELNQGELALDVVHDAKRPFQVEAGDLTATDIGTRFGVGRLGQGLWVAVREGEVRYAIVDQATSDTLKAGESVDYDAVAHQLQRDQVRTEARLAWTGGHLIYDNARLDIVAKDLSRYFDKPVYVDERIGDLRLNAMLTLDSETAVVGRVQTYLGIDAIATDKAIVLTAPHGKPRLGTSGG